MVPTPSTSAPQTTVRQRMRCRLCVRTVLLFLFSWYLPSCYASCVGWVHKSLAGPAKSRAQLSGVAVFFFGMIVLAPPGAVPVPSVPQSPSVSPQKNAGPATLRYEVLQDLLGLYLVFCQFFSGMAVGFSLCVVFVSGVGCCSFLCPSRTDPCLLQCLLSFLSFSFSGCLVCSLTTFFSLSLSLSLSLSVSLSLSLRCWGNPNPFWGLGVLLVSFRVATHCVFNPYVFTFSFTKVPAPQCVCVFFFVFFRRRSRGLFLVLFSLSRLSWSLGRGRRTRHHDHVFGETGEDRYPVRLL